MNFERGYYPRDHIVMAACDGKYLQAHGPAFAASVAINQMNSHIHLIDPTFKDLAFAYQLADIIKNKYRYNLTLSGEYSMIRSKYNEEQARTYFACSRFLVSPSLMESAVDVSGILLSDIDSLFMRRILHELEGVYDLGIFTREPLPGTVGWEAEGTKVAAGVFFFNRDTLWIAESVRDNIRKEIAAGNLNWFLDQVTLSKTFKSAMEYIEKYPQGSVPNIKKFTNQDMDWEFKEGTSIWTGKGPRKYDNPTYLAQKRYFEQEININVD